MHAGVRRADERRARRARRDLQRSKAPL